MKTIVSMGDVDAIKADLTRTLPEIKSSHRVEAMARGLGWNSNAHLRAELGDGTRRETEVSDAAFINYLNAHGFPDAAGTPLTDSVIRVAIRAQMDADPTLTHFGFQDMREERYAADREALLSVHALQEFRRAVNFLSTRKKRATLNRKASSYGWKHQAESHFQTSGGSGDYYVANGTLIAAARALGFTARRANPTPYALINIGDEIGGETAKRSRTKAFAGFVGGRQRLSAWRNLMVAAINAGLEQGLFGLEPDDNRWEGKHAIYRFDLAGLPGIAYVCDIGHGELSIHTAVRPTRDAERHIVVSYAGLSAGDGFASGWLERKDGRWLQASSKPCNAFRKDMLPAIAAVSIEPRGYADHGQVIM